MYITAISMLSTCASSVPLIWSLLLFMSLALMLRRISSKAVSWLFSMVNFSWTLTLVTSEVQSCMVGWASVYFHLAAAQKTGTLREYQSGGYDHQKSGNLDSHDFYLFIGSKVMRTQRRNNDHGQWLVWQLSHSIFVTPSTSKYVSCEKS